MMVYYVLLFRSSSYHQLGTYYLVVAFLFSLQLSGQNAESAFTYFLAMLLQGSQLRVGALGNGSVDVYKRQTITRSC